MILTLLSVSDLLSPVLPFFFLPKTFRFTFASASPDNIKQWYLPQGKFIQNLSGHNAIVNALTVSTDDILVSGGDNGSLNFWDYKTGYCFQQKETTPQPGAKLKPGGRDCKGCLCRWCLSTAGILLVDQSAQARWMQRQASLP